MSQENISSFYSSFVTTYLMQISRFQYLNEGKSAIGLFHSNFNNGACRCLYLAFDSRTPMHMRKFISDYLGELRNEFQSAIESLLTSNDKKHLFEERNQPIKIEPERQDYFTNIASFLEVNILINCIANSAKSYNQTRTAKICVILNFAKGKYTEGYYENEEEVDTFFTHSVDYKIKENKAMVVRSPYYGNLASGAIDPIINSETPTNLTHALEVCAETLRANAKFLSEAHRNQIIELIKFNPKYFDLRDTLQSLIECDHDAYSVFECKGIHCEQCLIDRGKVLGAKGGQTLSNEQCSCKRKYSSKDLKRLGFDVQTTSANLKTG